MKYRQVIEIFEESKLSPENIAKLIGLSNSTYRRWLKAPANDEFPKEYEQNVATGIYKLLNQERLSYESPKVSAFLETHLPEFFSAATKRFQRSEDLFAPDSIHQDKVTAILSNIGNSVKMRGEVDKSISKIRKFAQWGSEWKSRTQMLLGIIAAKGIASVDRLVAYGALFYLLLPLDMMPDAVPVFGFIDDFGMLGFAASYYRKKFPKKTRGD